MNIIERKRRLTTESLSATGTNLDAASAADELDAEDTDGMESDEEANSKATPPPKCRRGCVGRRRRLRRPISRPNPPPSVGWVVLLVGGVCFDRRWQNPGENRTARKRCRFFTGNSRGWRFKRGNRTGRKRCRFFSRRRLRPFRVGGRGRPQGHASPGRQQVLPWDS